MPNTTAPARFPEPGEPTTLAERKAKRARIRSGVLANAEIWAASANRSLKCSAQHNALIGPKHATDFDGCKNDGTGCLCECHDPTT